MAWPAREPATSGYTHSYNVSLGQADGLGDGYRYTATLTDLDELGDAA